MNMQGSCLRWLIRHEHKNGGERESGKIRSDRENRSSLERERETRHVKATGRETCRRERTESVKEKREGE